MKIDITAKEEAMRLYCLYRGFNNESADINKNVAIQCASIHVDELIDVLQNKLDFENTRTLLFYIDVKYELTKIK